MTSSTPVERGRARPLSSDISNLRRVTYFGQRTQMDANEKVRSRSLEVSHSQYSCFVILSSPKVEFCGYSAPHPSENLIHLRIQMFGTQASCQCKVERIEPYFTDGLSSLTALLQALDDLDNLCTVVENAYHRSLNVDSYEKWDEKS